jgi:hypothetical protein
MRYFELVSDEEYAKLCQSKVNTRFINEVIREIQHTCENENCEQVFYYFPKMWKNKKICEPCYNTATNIQERLNMWRRIEEYYQMREMNYCRICRKVWLNWHEQHERFQFDHINLFNKSDSICHLVAKGYEWEEILEELRKCQILCVSCHNIITSMENKLGLIRLKTNIIIQVNNGNLTAEEKEEKMRKYQEMFDEMMGDIYGKIRTYFDLFCDSRDT